MRRLLLLVMLVVTGALVCAACGGDDDSEAAPAEVAAPEPAPAPEPAAPEPAPELAPEPAPSEPSPPEPAGTPLVWERVTIDESVAGEDSFMRDVGASGSMLVATGQVGEREALWVSRDAREWVLVPDALGPGDISVGAIASYGPGAEQWVAVGIEADTSAAVWLSDGGEVWRRVSSDALQESGARLWMLGVAVGADGLVAGGQYDSEAGNRAAFWMSLDGEEWTRVQPDAVHGDDPAQSQQVGGIVSVSVGFVAWGWESPDFVAIKPAIWTSEDGREWERAAADGPAHEDSNVLRGVAESEGQLIAVGNSRRGPLIMHSTDGQSWTVRDFEADTDETVWVADVLATDGGFVIVGSVDAPDGSSSGIAFTSRDGVAWTMMGDEQALAGGRPNRVVGFQEGLVAVGNEDLPQGSQTAVWTAK